MTTAVCAGVLAGSAGLGMKLANAENQPRVAFPVASTPEAHGVIRNFSYRVDAKGDASFERLRPIAPAHLWYATCNTHLEGICAAYAGPLIVVVDAVGSVRMMTEEAGFDRISIASGPGSYERPYLFGAPIDPKTLAILTQEGARIELERGWRVRVELETEGLDLVLDFLAYLRSQEATTVAWTFQNRGKIVEGVAPRLRHLALSDESNRSPDWKVVPQRKPQSEFAIRAQTVD